MTLSFTTAALLITVEDVLNKTSIGFLVFGWTLMIPALIALWKGSLGFVLLLGYPSLLSFLADTVCIAIGMSITIFRVSSGSLSPKR